jgi:hypothetical protein
MLNHCSLRSRWGLSSAERRLASRQSIGLARDKGQNRGQASLGAEEDRTMYTGSCLCGAVRFEVSGNLPGPDACHCTQCRKWTGHYLVGTDVPRAALTLHGAEHVTWYHSSEKARRGFCARCGSSLFWDPLDRIKHDWIGVSMGAFDGPTDTRIRIHIHVADKGDYYDIADGVPQKPH